MTTSSTTTPTTMTAPDKVIVESAIERSATPTVKMQPSTAASAQRAIPTSKPAYDNGTPESVQSGSGPKQAVRVPASASSSPAASPTPLNTNRPASKHESVIDQQGQQRALEAKEKELQDSIKTLWALNQTKSAQLKGDRERLKTAKANLQRVLCDYKTSLAGTGRDGKWAPFLRQIGMSLSTADRYVKQWRENHNPANKLLTEDLPLTKEQIAKLAAKVSKGLAKSLKTPSSIAIFLEALQGNLRASAIAAAVESSAA